MKISEIGLKGKIIAMRVKPHLKGHAIIFFAKSVLSLSFKSYSEIEWWEGRESLMENPWGFLWDKYACIRKFDYI